MGLYDAAWMYMVGECTQNLNEKKIRQKNLRT